MIVVCRLAAVRDAEKSVESVDRSVGHLRRDRSTQISLHVHHFGALCVESQSFTSTCLFVLCCFLFVRAVSAVAIRVVQSRDEAGVLHFQIGFTIDGGGFHVRSGSLHSSTGQHHYIGRHLLVSKQHNRVAHMQFAPLRVSDGSVVFGHFVCELRVDFSILVVSLDVFDAIFDHRNKHHHNHGAQDTRWFHGRLEVTRFCCNHGDDADH
mmetsp:Transcript_54252/g.94638  ORF Transcript_54252/g.94638 Transcript_54252/m.94638 type:complete len:209 (-) Transcript_54252:307-933(-)